MLAADKGFLRPGVLQMSRPGSTGKLTNKAYYVEHGLLTYRTAYLKAHWRDEFEAEARNQTQ